MKHTDYTGAYEALGKAELRELAAALKAHGGAYKFDGDDPDKCAVISAIPKSGFNAEDFRVTQAILSDGDVRIFGIPVDDYEECELDTSDMVICGQVGYIIDAIPETEGVKEVSAPKTKAYVAFGTEAVRSINSGDIDAIPDCDIEDPDMFRIREFDTEAEAKAYKKGLDDADGWRDYAVLSPLDPDESKIIEKINKREHENGLAVDSMDETSKAEGSRTDEWWNLYTDFCREVFRRNIAENHPYADAFRLAYEQTIRLRTIPGDKTCSTPVDHEALREWAEKYSQVVDAVCNNDKENIRCCEQCGFPMIEGFYLAGEFACCEECCLKAYHGDIEQMEEDLSHAEEIDGECYWTEWDSVTFE